MARLVDLGAVDGVYKDATDRIHDLRFSGVVDRVVHQRPGVGHIGLSTLFDPVHRHFLASDQGIRIGLRFVEQRKRSFGQNRILHQLAQWHCASVGPWPFAIAQSEYVPVLLFVCEIACY